MIFKNGLSTNIIPSLQGTISQLDTYIVHPWLQVGCQIIVVTYTVGKWKITLANYIRKRGNGYLLREKEDKNSWASWTPSFESQQTLHYRPGLFTQSPHLNWIIRISFVLTDRLMQTKSTNNEIILFLQNQHQWSLSSCEGGDGLRKLHL